MERLKWSNTTKKFSKSLHHVGLFRVVKKKDGNGEYRMVVCAPWWSGVKDDWHTLTDTHVMDVFLWLGRYLALKGKLPRHLSLEAIAVGAQRTSKAIREVVATEIYAAARVPGGESGK